MPSMRRNGSAWLEFCVDKATPLRLLPVVQTGSLEQAWEGKFDADCESSPSSSTANSHPNASQSESVNIFASD